ncbi:aspartate/glutamate racemase family protein [Dactylosporangium sp. NPDC000521]|uniref:aspartate/glutamate racemase family protein n=1 Tax=Dactylosporangium sp. NPDC000521 TaxID=3363975 RepID=UPI0036B3337D
MPIIGFLHTADVHVATFRALLADAAPDAGDLHAVDAALLEDARAGADVKERLAARLRALAADGADVVVCTCSTLSGLAETVDAGVPVLRVDRPMAEAAVAGGGRVAVVAALASTLAPTAGLLRECAALAGATVEIVEAPCLDAWALFESGELDAYVRRVAEHVRAVAATADVVVLAQASMAPAADLLPDLPVLSSPRAAVTAALRSVGKRGPVG